MKGERQEMKEALLIDDHEVGTLVQQPPPTSLLHPESSPLHHHGNHNLKSQSHVGSGGGSSDPSFAVVGEEHKPPPQAAEGVPQPDSAAHKAGPATPAAHKEHIATHKRASGVVHFVAGGVGGMAGAIVTCPLEVVKTRMQSSLYNVNPRRDLQKYGPPMPPQPPVVSYPQSTSSFPPQEPRPRANPIYNGIGGTSPSFHSISMAIDSPVATANPAFSLAGELRNSTAAQPKVLPRPARVVYDLFAKPIQMMSSIYHTEGLAALWKGLGPNLVGIIPSRAIYFGTYSQGKYFLMELNHGKENSAIHLGAAAVAGITVATVTCPLWVVKTRMQLQSSAAKLGGVKVTDATIPYKNSFDCVKRIVLEEGAKGLYKGLTASYLGVIESTLQFVMYEKLKGIMRKHRAENPPTFLPPHLQEWTDYFFIAAGSKLSAALITYPHEVVRTRMREAPVPGKVFKYSSVKSTVQVLFKEEGIAPFYGGLGAHLLRVVPNAAIMFLGYELVVKVFEK